VTETTYLLHLNFNDIPENKDINVFKAKKQSPRYQKGLVNMSKQAKVRISKN